MEPRIPLSDRRLIESAHDAAVLGIIWEDGTVSLRLADPLVYDGHVSWIKQDRLLKPYRGFSLGVWHGQVAAFHRESVVNSEIGGTLEAELTAALLGLLPLAEDVQVFPALDEGLTADDT